MGRYRVQSRAFIVVELPVVVSIIALLAAILLPSLKQAKARSLRAVCTSNLRQIGISLFSYSGDYQGSLPPSGMEYLPSRLYFTQMFWNGSATVQTLADMRGLCPEYGSSRVWVCPGFMQSAAFRDSSWRNYWMPWWDSPPVWDTAADGGGNFLGYYYIKPSHLTWEMRYGIYQGLHSLRMGDKSPCGHDPDGSFDRSVMLASCITYNNDYNITPYWTAMPITLGHPWRSASHEPSRPRGANYMMGDAHVEWADIDQLTYQYNGWATVDWWKIR
jgi:hypothetical protein